MLAMDVSPKTLREVEFREKMRGYHPEDVDQFLEEVAVGLEVLQDRLRQAVERAQRAEAAAAEAGGSDETLRRTLVLAQRTADMAVQEAREQAARILAGAEQQAQALLSEAEERAKRSHEEAMSEVRSELARLESVRQQAEAEVGTIRRWVEEHRNTLTSSLKDALAMLEGAGLNSPPPTSRPVEVPPPPAANGTAQALPAPVEDAEGHTAGPPTATWSPGDDTGEARVESFLPPQRRQGSDAARDAAREEGRGDPGGQSPMYPPVEAGGGPDEQALDDFFDDDQFADERRFGGRLRRRR